MGKGTGNYWVWPQQLFFIAIYLSSSLSAAAPPDPYSDLTWEKSVALIWKKNPELKAYQLDLKSNEFGVAKIDSGFLPTLSLVGAWQPYSYSGLALSPSTYQYFGPQASWTIFSGFQTVAQHREAKATVKKAESAVAQVRVKLLNDLRTYFANALFAEKNIEVTERIEKRLSSYAKFLQLRYKGGLEARWAYLKAAADANEAQWEVKKAYLDNKSAQKRLVQTLGLDSDVAVKAAGNFATESVLPTPPLENHPDIEFQSKYREVNQWSVDEQLSGYWPTVTLAANYYLQNTNGPPNLYAWQVGLQINLPIFSGFFTAASVAQARANFQREDSNLRKIVQQTHANLENANNDYQSAKLRIAVAEQELEAARERAKVVQEEYSAGLKTFLDYDQAQSDLTFSEKDYVQSQRDTMIALATLEKAQGKQLPE
jgi:outer membrane protein TolC